MAGTVGIISFGMLNLSSNDLTSLLSIEPLYDLSVKSEDGLRLADVKRVGSTPVMNSAATVLELGAGDILGRVNVILPVL
jgi:hypothetical protein